MQSVIQKKSYNSVQVFWLNKDLLKQKINEAIKRLVKAKSEVQKAVLFGSFAEGKAAVSSDVDILLIVKKSENRFIDRPSEFRDFFEDVELGVDIFVYTQDELKNDIGLVKNALQKGKILFNR